MTDDRDWDTREKWKRRIPTVTMRDYVLSVANDPKRIEEYKVLIELLGQKRLDAVASGKLLKDFMKDEEDETRND